MAVIETGAEAPEAVFFLFEPTSKAPEPEDLARKARTAQGGRELLLAVLEDTGLRPSEEDIASAKGVVRAGLTDRRRSIDQDVTQADNTYHSLFFRGPKRGQGVDLNAIVRLYDATQEYDGTTILGLIGKVRSSLPPDAETARINTIEADCIARLVIAQNVGNIAVGDLFVEPIEADGPHPVS